MRALLFTVSVAALLLLMPGQRILAAPQTVSLSGDSGGGYPTSATATVFGDGFSLAYAGGSTKWQSITVTDVATGATVASCPGSNCAVTAWNAFYVSQATITGLQPGVAYNVSILELDVPLRGTYEFEDLSPNLTTGAPVGQLTLSGPAGYPPSNPYQIQLSLSTDTVEQSLTWTLRQEQVGPSGAQVPFASCPSPSTLSGGDCLYSLPVSAGDTATMTTANQRQGGPGYVYRYTATAAGYATAAIEFANAPTFFVHRRARGLFVTWPDLGDGAEYDVFGGPGGGGCTSPSFNELLPPGTTQLAIGGLTPNTQYAVCMWAEIPGQPVASGGWLPTWWVAGGNANGGGMWYTLPDVPGQPATGGLLAAYYDVPALATGAGGPAVSLFGSATSYAAVQGPIDFATICNCTASWPYVGHGGPMPATAAQGGTAQGFAAKLLGWLYAPSTGTYTIGCRADDACQVWVNGTIVADGMTSAGPAPNYYGACNACGGVAGGIALTAGNWYPLEVDYAQGGGAAALDLYWIPPGGARADVPAGDLAYPVLAGAAGGSFGNAALSWAPDGNPAGTGYQLLRDVLSPSGGIAATGVIYQGAATSFTTTDLQAGEVTAYYVRAVSGDGFWTPSTVEPGGGGYLYADTPPPTVAPPSTTGQITVSWSDVGDGAHYAVIWSVEPSYGTFQTSGDLGAGSTGYTISGLEANTEYFVALDAWIPETAGVGGQRCTGGSGGGCWWAGATDGGQWTLAAPVSSLQVSGAGSAVTLSWDDNGNPSGTVYRWSVAPPGGSATTATGSTTGLQAVASGLSCQTDYASAVYAINGAGVPSATVAATAETGICPPAPEVGLSIDDGLAQTSSASVTLDVTASDVNYPQPQLQMRFSNDGSAWSSWQPYAATAAWTVDGAAGPNTVYAQVRDPDGGVGSATATITYDSSLSSLTGTAGAPCSYLGLAALCVRSPIITAPFAMPSGSVAMEISLDNTNWSPPQDAKAQVDLVLPSGDGLKAVFARYFNRQDVATTAAPDYYVLDTAPPSVQVGWLGDAAVTDSGAATLTVQAADAVMPVASLKVDVGGAAAWSGRLPPDGQIPLTLSGRGYVTVTVTVTDPAGNEATATAGIYNVG